MTDLGLTDLVTVLDEYFAVLDPFAEQLPDDLVTVEDLAERHGSSVDRTIFRLNKIIGWDRDVALSLSGFRRLGDRAKTTLLDLRADPTPAFRDPRVRPLRWANAESLLREAEDDHCIVALCEDGRRSYSFALGLRQMGYSQARFLEGGIGESL